MQIRPETLSDQRAIHFLTEAAFKIAPHSNQTEARIIDSLRLAGALTISLVAGEADSLLGHVAFSPVMIREAIGDWYGLGPVSVRPDRQRRGVGAALIRNGLERLVALKAAGCVVLGEPSYYGRFGFESDAELYYGDAPRAYFQRLIFHGSSPKGEVTYHPGFDTL